MAGITLNELLHGEIDVACADIVAGTGFQLHNPETVTKPKAVFPGAFNPLHEGHRLMAGVAQRQIATPVEYEISVLNVDKPQLAETEIASRLKQFPWGLRVWLTRAPTFVEKAKIFSGAHFIVGVDTVMRVADSRYYDNDPAATIASIRKIADRACRFLVFGRAIGSRFLTLSDLDLPDELLAICDEVPETDFRCDVSSTGIRKQDD